MKKLKELKTLTFNTIFLFRQLYGIWGVENHLLWEVSAPQMLLHINVVLESIRKIQNVSYLGSIIT